MSRVARRFGVALGLVLVWPWPAPAARPEVSPQGGRPDPMTVERYGPAYRYPRAGWIVLHIEGEPYERGYQHGRLLAPEIADYVKALATKRSPKAPADAWRETRTLVNALFLRRYDAEYLEEMKGIADGAAAAGAQFRRAGRSTSSTSSPSTPRSRSTFLDGALDATANGLEGQAVRASRPSVPAPEPRSRALQRLRRHRAGDRRRQGRLRPHHHVRASTMVRHFNVWLDVKPARGHRVLMQTYPGGIQSGMDYYMNDAGLLVAETTIAPDQVRPRRPAARLAGSAGPSSTPTRSTTPSPILEDGEQRPVHQRVAAGRHEDQRDRDVRAGHRTRASSGGAARTSGSAARRGSTGAATTPRTSQVRLETVAERRGQARQRRLPPLRPRPDVAPALRDAQAGKIDAGFGFEAFTTPPLAAFPSCDAKFTTTAMARELKTWALFGPPLGRTWEPDRRPSAARFPDIRPLVGNDWTVLTADVPPPPSGTTARRPSISPASTSRPGRRPTRHCDLPPIRPPAWHGTILPAPTPTSGWPPRSPTTSGSSPSSRRSARGRAMGRLDRPERGPARPGPVRPALALPDRRRAPRRRHSALAEIRVGPDPRRVVPDRLRQGRPPPGRAPRDDRRRGLPEADGRLRPRPCRQARLDRRRSAAAAEATPRPALERLLRRLARGDADCPGRTRAAAPGRSTPSRPSPSGP